LTDDTKKFVLGVGEEFTIKVQSNPTTGYKWQPLFDDNILKEISHDFIPVSNMTGSSGMERFNFKAMKPGTTSVKMIYKRVWEKQPAEEKEFSVIVT
jgi:inhibitor of cysteine peptidase